MRTVTKLLILITLFFHVLATATEPGLIVKAVRYSTYATFTRIVFEVEVAAPYVVTRSPDGRSIMLGAYEGPFVIKSPLPTIHNGVVAGIEPRDEAGRTYAVIRLDTAAGQVKDFTLRGPDRIVVDIAKVGAASPLNQPAEAGRPLLVVLDPGHGGKDAGLIAGQGAEKTFNLDIALAVKKQLSKTGQFKIMLTREKDQSLTLNERAALANTVGASLFVSVHAAMGIESRVYIQDLIDDSSGPSARSRSTTDFLGFESQSEKQDVIWGKQQAAHIQQSGLLGREIAQHLGGRTGMEPVQVPLAGLNAVDAAAVMVEVGMGQDRARAAEEIAEGIERYVLDNR